jgi:hypothetical protein
MNYPIPASSQEIAALGQKTVNEELVVAAIAGVINVARLNGQSLDELMAEILADDTLLDKKQRNWLGEVVAVAWKNIPASETRNAEFPNASEAKQSIRN